MISTTNCYTVYVHTNTVNGKRYVGVTSCSLRMRFKKGGLGYRNNKSMWEDIQKHGWDNFTHEILATECSADTAYSMEADLICKYRSNNPKYGYNVYPGGYQVPSGKDNAMSKAVNCVKDGQLTKYGSIREASRATGESLYCIRKSIKTEEPTSKGFTFTL